MNRAATIFSGGSIESDKGSRHVDFANKYIGGGTLLGVPLHEFRPSFGFFLSFSFSSSFTSLLFSPSSSLLLLFHLLLHLLFLPSPLLPLVNSLISLSSLC